MPPGRSPSGAAMSIVLDNAGMADPRSAAAASENRPPRPPMPRNNALMDALFRNLTRFFAFLVFALLGAILVSLVHGSALSIERFGLPFLWTAEWDPVAEEFGALVPIFGTLVTSAIALAI